METRIRHGTLIQTSIPKPLRPGAFPGTFSVVIDAGNTQQELPQS
ncbi:hypothetical protein B4168_0320 [Anoxybacillus flavithermus]|nr:hypothetical protein B4168_0320 [Anoxybacillus flavithermus]OAO83731.1 hypothetical protein GT23_4041 [Parageobacillus thermoglucosidasius]